MKVTTKTKTLKIKIHRFAFDLTDEELAAARQDPEAFVTRMASHVNGHKKARRKKTAASKPAGRAGKKKDSPNGRRRQPRVRCPECGLEVAKSRLNIHLQRKHGYSSATTAPATPPNTAPAAE